MKNNLDHTHKRYYIFRHVPKTDPIQYREATGCWVDDFERAQLWASYDFVVKKATELNADLQRQDCTKDFVVVIGRVVVDIDPFFPGEAI